MIICRTRDTEIVRLKRIRWLARTSGKSVKASFGDHGRFIKPNATDKELAKIVDSEWRRA